MSETESVKPPSGFRYIINNTLVRVLAALTVAYWTLAAFLPGNLLIEVVTMALIGMLIVVIYRWFWIVADEISHGMSGGRAQLAVGILSFSMSSIGVLAWSLVWRWTGYEQWMVDHAFLGFMRLWSVVGAGLMVTAPGAISGSIPPSNWRWIMLAIAIGAGLFGYSLGTTKNEEITSSRMIASDRSSANRPKCDPSEPVIGSRSGIYHDTSSPNRSQVEVPVNCFATVEDARRAGYRPPR